MRKGLRALAFVAVCAGLLIAAPLTATAAQAKTGTVTGRTRPDMGGDIPLKMRVYPNWKVTLGAYQGKTLVRRGSFSVGATFRFALPPGAYVIDGKYCLESSPFRIRSGRTTHVDLDNVCP
jgi:hypothetical protein